LLQVATCGDRRRRAYSRTAGDDESATVRPSAAAAAVAAVIDRPSRCPVEDVDATQMTELGAQQPRGLCAGRRRQQ